MSEEAAAFDGLASEFFTVWFRFHPDVAAAAGVPGFETLLPAQGDDELAALAGWLETLVVALEELDYVALDEPRRIDLRLMFAAARVEHQELLARDWRQRDPLRFLPVAEIYHLVMRGAGGAPGILPRLLEALPEYLRRALSQLRVAPQLIPPALALAAAEEAERGRCWLRGLASSPWARDQAGEAGRLERLADAACTALAGFGEAMGREIAPRAGASVGCGGAQLTFLMRHRHFVELDPDRLRGVLAAALDLTEEGIAECCARLGIPRSEAAARAAGSAVPSAGRVDAARQVIDRSRDLLAAAGLASLPDAPLSVRDHAPCSRPWRAGSDYLADDRGGWIDLPLLAKDGAESLGDLRARCLAGGWGGAHLLAFAGAAAGRRLPRRLCPVECTALAWSLYLEDCLAAVGLLSTEERLHALLRRRAALDRGLADLSLNLAPISPGEPSGSDLVPLARRPGDALAAALGWQALTRAGALQAKRQGAAFDERAFHDRLLAQGPIPLPLALCTVLGGSGWRAVCEPWADPSVRPAV